MALTTACGSDKPQCDPAACAAGNTCIEENGETQCRRLCSSQFERDTGCPFNFACVTRAAVVDGQLAGYCSKNRAALNEQPKGQWGARCNPVRGRDANVDCDIDQEFRCYGEGTKDAESYCTRYGCTDDRDCTGGYFCATVNKFPDVTRDERSIRETTRVCKKRAYCAPCTSDLDCPSFGANAAACVSDANGQRFCTQQCDVDGGCNNEAQCTTVPDALGKVCFPRAGVCVGDGSVCAPCRADTDCPQGLCAKTEYSTERFCTRTSGLNCGVFDGVFSDGDCPGIVNGAKYAGCFISDDPWWQHQCTGYFTLGDEYITGCWTPSR